jgi:nucleoside-diphosphate-sugar epimerase
VREQAASPAGRTDYEWLQADIGTARALLDWRPGRDLDESLRDLWQETLAGC